MSGDDRTNGHAKGHGNGAQADGGPGSNGQVANGQGTNGQGTNGQGANGQGTNGQGANGQGANGQGGDGDGRKRRNRKRRNRSNARALSEFWGDEAALPEASADIRITPDPAAVVRSLGRPPLPGHEQAAEAYFAAVYGRAVGLASALAAAGELIAPEELIEG